MKIQAYVLFLSSRGSEKPKARGSSKAYGEVLEKTVLSSRVIGMICFLKTLEAKIWYGSILRACFPFNNAPREHTKTRQEESLPQQRTLH